MSLLTVKQLGVAFSTEQGMCEAVDDISFTVDKAETVALVGESGSGKSITALAIMQLLPYGAHLSPKSAVYYNDKNLFHLTEIEMRRMRGRKIGMIFQEAMTALNPVLTIGQQINEVLKKHFRLTRNERNAEILSVLEQVGLSNPEDVSLSYAHQLSGGMRQRAMIAMALAGKPECLIADEPTTSLDVTIQAQVLELLKNLQQQHGMSLLFITHDLGIVKKMADRVIVMQEGKIVEVSDSSQFFSKPNHPYSKKLIKAVPSLISQPTVEKKEKLLLSVDRLKTYFPIRKGVFKRVVDEIKAVDNVSFKIERGKTLALVGESGSGKTTTGMSILQLYHPTSGSIEFMDQNLVNLKLSQLKKLRKQLQVIFQDPYASMNPRMLVGDIIAEGMRAQNLYSSDERKNKIDKLLQLVGLEPSYKNRYPHEFSGGQRQRICIARALSVEPKFIVCDEPTSALDVTIQKQILELLKKLQEELGIAYLLITHNIGVVNYLAHDVAVMYRGKIVEYGTRESVLFNPQHDYTKRLLASVPKI